MDEPVIRITEPMGDSACWLARVCSECGAIDDGPQPPRCPRCGAPANADRADADAE